MSEDEDKKMAYRDRAYRNGYVHLSAPHMYGGIVEALELKKGLSFLHIGSGVGYLSSIVSILIGQDGVSHGVELRPDAVCLHIYW